MKKGRCATMTHDYKRNGTTTLFAAFDIERGDFSGAIEALAPLAGQNDRIGGSRA